MKTPTTLFEAPNGTLDRPEDAACLECGKPVPPYRMRLTGRWLARTLHEKCRVRRDRAGAELDRAREAVEALCSGDLAMFAGFSLHRTANLGEDAPPQTLRIHKDNAKAILALIEWQPGQSVVLEGPVGTGKTALLMAFVQDQMQTLTDSHTPTARAVRYFTAPGLSQAIFQRQKERPSDDAITWALSGSVLVLDDLGTERHGGYMRDWWDNIVGQLIDRAYTGQRSIAISTNLNADALIERYPAAGERLVSRLRGMCEGRWLKVGGVNFRERS